MALPTLTSPPPAPSRTQDADIFNTNVANTIAWWAIVYDEIPALGNAIEQAKIDAEAAAVTAAEEAAASAGAVEARDQAVASATAAATSANNAADSADDAAASAAAAQTWNPDNYWGKAEDLPAPHAEFASKTDTASTTSTTWVDTGLSVTITLTNATSRVLVSAILAAVSGASNGYVFFRLVRGATTLLQGDAVTDRRQVHFGTYGSDIASLSGQAVDAPGSIGPHTYKVQWIVDFGTGYLNRKASENTGAPRLASTLSAQEIAA